jgi:hypothetical protein
MVIPVVLANLAWLANGCSSGYDDVTIDAPASDAAKPAGGATTARPFAEEGDSAQRREPSLERESSEDQVFGGQEDVLGQGSFSSGAEPASGSSLEPEDPASQPVPPASHVEGARTSRSAVSRSIRLSSGVALAQTGPTGTMMGFHVDYRFVQGRPDPSGQYVLVIERARGEPMRQPVRLQAQGSLEGFVLQWRPEHGPFQARIEDAQGTRLSKDLPLR